MSRAVRVKAAAGALAAAGLLSGCAGSQAAQNGPGGSDDRFIAGDGTAQVVRASERKAAPSVEGTTLEDKAFRLADLKGKVVVVNFWASWCAPCRGEAPALQRLYTEHRPAGVEFLGIDIRDSKDAAKAMERNFKVAYPSLFDSDGRVTLAFKDVPPNAVPSTLVLDRQGRVAVRIIGATTYSTLGPMIKQIVAEK